VLELLTKAFVCDALKVDCSFVKDMTQRPETRAMLRSLVVLAHELGMRVIVEGIETCEQLKLIEDLEVETKRRGTYSAGLRLIQSRS